MRIPIDQQKALFDLGGNQGCEVPWIADRLVGRREHLFEHLAQLLTGFCAYVGMVDLGEDPAVGSGVSSLEDEPARMRGLVGNECGVERR